MPEFGSAVFIGGFLFSSIGFVAFVYGKRMHIWRPMFIGLALMAYPLLHLQHRGRLLPRRGPDRRALCLPRVIQGFAALVTAARAC